MSNRKRDKQVKFFVTEKELEQIDKKSEKAKMNRSEFLRAAALKKEIVINEIKDLEEFTKFIFELNKLGVNLHQIIKKINADIDTEEDFKNLVDNQEKLKLILDNIYLISEGVKEWQR